jgi:type IV secretion system protein VirD4
MNRRPQSAGSDELLAFGLVALAGVATALGAVVWLAGEVSGWLATGRWSPTSIRDSLAILLRLPAHTSAPAMAWPSSARPDLSGPLPFYVVLVLLLALIGGAGARIVVAFIGNRRQAFRLRDVAREWAQARDVAPLLLRRRMGTRVPLGRLGNWRGPLVAAEERRSVLVVAPTQAGKTTRFVIPTLLDWAGPVVITSVKSDVLRATFAERGRRGRVHVFDPTATTGLATSKWSPLLACTSYEMAERAASWLVEAAGEPRGGELTRYFESLSAKMLGPALFAAAQSGGGMMRVAQWIDRRDFAGLGNVLRSIGDRDAIDAWTASTSREVRQRDSVLGTVESLIRTFVSPSIREAIDVSDDAHLAGRVVDVRRLLRDAETLYLVAPEHEQSRLRPLFEALLQAVVRSAQDMHAATGKPLDPPLLLMLDEAAHIAPLRDLAVYAASGAGQGIQFVSVWQDLAQIKKIYAESAATIVNGHTARVFLTGSADLATLEELSRVIGDHSRPRRSTTFGNDGNRSTSESEQESRLAPVEYIRQLPSETAICLYGRYPPMRLHTKAWFQDRRMRSLVDEAAVDRAAPPPTYPQVSALSLDSAGAVGSRGRTDPRHKMEDAMTQKSSRPAAPTKVSGLAGVPGSDRFVQLETGREYILSVTEDGTRVPVPVEMTEDERQEIDRRRDQVQQLWWPDDENDSEAAAEPDDPAPPTS